MFQKPKYIVEVELSKEQLSAINRLLGLAFSPTAKSIRPKTSLETLIRAVERKQIEMNYYEK